MTNKNQEIISLANPHTLKKFELIERYVKSWAHKLLNNDSCKGLVFIDCMSNSGEYVDDAGKTIYGTPVRAAKYLRDVAGQYPKKQIELYFSDLLKEKTEHLERLMPNEKANYHIHISAEDGNDLAKRVAHSLITKPGYSCLLVYDPYQATIDWAAIAPFINGWNEVIINHMVSDPVRAVKMVKSEQAKEKYEKTYLKEIEELIPFGGDRAAYEKRLEEIVKELRKNKKRKYFIAAFPFFNEKNSVVFNLVHCTGNIKGFRLYKETAWQTFGGKSSNKNTHGIEDQYLLDLEGDGFKKTMSDDACFFIKDVAEYLQERFDGKANVPLNDVWAALDEHPLFPSDGFKLAIKNELKEQFNASQTKDGISFASRKGTK